MSALKPCPFCGGKRPRLFMVEPARQADGLVNYVHCQRIACMATGPSFLQFSADECYPLGKHPRELAVAAWNNRKD